MQLRPILLAGLAVLAIAGCGKKEGAAPEAKSSASAANASAPSPLQSSFKLPDAKAIDVDALFALFPDDGRPTYSSAEFDAKLGATIISNLRFSDRHGGADDIGALTVERAELYGVDLDAIDRVKTGAAAVDAPFETLFQKLRLFGVTPDRGADGSSMTIGAVELDRLRIRRGGLPQGAGKENPAHFFNALELSGLYLKDLVVKGAGEASGAVSVNAPDLRIVGVGGGKIAAIISNDAEYNVSQTAATRAIMAQTLGPAAGFILSGPLSGFIAPDSQRAKVKSFDWRGVDFSGLLAYGLKNERPPFTARNLVNLGTMKVSGMETFIGEKRAQLIGEMTASALEFTWLFPSKIRVETKGEQYDFSAYMPASEAQAIAVLKKHGLDKVKASGNFSWDWDANKGGASLNAKFDSVGLADTTLRFDLAGLELAKIGAAIDAGDKDAVFTAGALKALNLTIADEKLLDALFEISALQMGSTAQELRQSAPAMVRLSGAQAAALSPRIPAYVDAVATFIEQGGVIEISASPSSPVSFSNMSSAMQSEPQAALDLLDLKVTHRKK